MDSHLHLCFLAVILYFLLIQILNFLIQYADLPALFLQPEQIQVGQILFHLFHLFCDLYASLVIIPTLLHSAVYKKTAKEWILALVLCQLSPNGLPAGQFCLSCSQLRFQLFNPQGHRPASNEGVLHQLFPQRAGHIALIDHALRSDSCPVFPELANVGTAHYTA